jgi:hypothetical protein
MKIINLNLEDGLGTVSVAVKDCLDGDRIIKFVRDAAKSIEANQAREEQETAVYQCELGDETKYLHSQYLADRHANLGWTVTKLYTRPS